MGSICYVRASGKLGSATPFPATLGVRSDTFFSQKVRNLISHKDSPNNMIAKGYAEHDAEKEGLRITNKGRAFLASLSD